MIHIIKGAEPQSLKDCRKTPGAVFQDVDKSDLRNSLLREQGFLCAYCMTRIHNDENTKIEHYEARNPENEMVYANLLAVCKGNETLRGSEGKVDPQRFTCDT